MLFERFVVWKQVRAAPGNTTNTTKNKRAFVCLAPIGAPQQEPQEAPNTLQKGPEWLKDRSKMLQDAQDGLQTGQQASKTP